MARKNSSHHAGQEVEKELLYFYAFFIFYLHSMWTPSYEIGIATFKDGLPKLVNPLWKYPHRITRSVPC
jgi:hypothetical protein